jgi:putative ABC transport system substrate-binding protein
MTAFLSLPRTWSVQRLISLWFTGGPAPVAAKKATTTIPIVLASGGRSSRRGSDFQSGATGRQRYRALELNPELNTKRLEILKDAIPRLSRVGFLRSPVTNLQVKETRAAAPSLKLRLEEIETGPNPKGLEIAFQTANEKQVGAIMTITTRRFFAQRKRIVELAGKYRLPAIYFQKEFVDEGGLMSYGADYDDLYRRAAVYVDKILKGAKPADLPVQQATKFEFIINLKAAKQIGLTIPVNVLERANKVIR